ncbi:MAG: hypothetical protein IJS66_07200 [Bacteroidales bacterium]|nr:hypothetical protein [Bacteroidales bacterium]
MKKYLVILCCLCGVLAASSAQVPTERMKAIHMAAVRIADRIGVKEPARSEFIQLYQEFKKESAAVLSVKPAATGNTEDAVEAKIYADFEKSEKILSLRKTYYEKFRTVLSPSQIQAMYDLEKEFNARR